MSGSYCWRQRADRNPKPCPLSKCCYDASCQAVFEYWKFINSKQWKDMIKKEMEKVKKEMEKEREKAIQTLYPNEKVKNK